MSTLILLSDTGNTGLTGLFTQTDNSASIGGAIATGSIIGTGVGTLTVPANMFQVGDSFKVTMAGGLDALNNKKLQIKIGASGGATLASTGQITMPNCTNQHWNLEITFTIRKLGLAGLAEIASNGYFLYTKDASVAFEGENFGVINNTTFDTTINNTLTIIADWDTNDVGNAIYSETLVLTKIY